MIYSVYLLYAAVATLLYLLIRATYRLYFHPLAKIPGPKLAALSTAYEWYSDCIQPGTFSWKIQHWHRQYGNIVRIGPNEVHVDDPDWFDLLYSPSMKLDKDPWFYGFLGSDESTFAVSDYHTHRLKRNKQNPFFSRQNVDRSAPVITEVLENMLNQFDRFRGTGKPLAIRYALKSFSADVVCKYCFPSAIDFVKAPEFSKAFQDGQENFARMLPWIRHFPFLGKLLTGLPAWLVPYMDKETQACMSFIKFIELQVEEVTHQSQAMTANVKRTIIKEIYESDLPERHRTSKVLEQEALSLVAAGTATTSRLLEGGLYYILSNPMIRRKLSKEVRTLRTSEPGRILNHRELENLPYLTAVVLECQRFLPATPSRFPRIIQNQDMFYKGHHPPKTTCIGMAVWDVLLSEKIWGNPFEFDPSRWLDPVHKAKMQRYLVSFGRGSRNCIGQNLAVAELYFVLGNLFRLFDIELFATDEQQILCVQDCFEALPFKGSIGVRVLLA